jgi:hypothetical protein
MAEIGAGMCRERRAIRPDERTRFEQLKAELARVSEEIDGARTTRRADREEIARTLATM